MLLLLSIQLLFSTQIGWNGITKTLGTGTKAGFSWQSLCNPSARSAPSCRAKASQGWMIISYDLPCLVLLFPLLFSYVSTSDDQNNQQTFCACLFLSSLLNWQDMKSLDQRTVFFSRLQMSESREAEYIYLSHDFTAIIRFFCFAAPGL